MWSILAKNVFLDIFVQDLKLGCEVLDTSSISFACVCLFNKLDQRGMSNVNIKILYRIRKRNFDYFKIIGCVVSIQRSRWHLPGKSCLENFISTWNSSYLGWCIIIYCILWFHKNMRNLDLYSLDKLCSEQQSLSPFLLTKAHQSEKSTPTPVLVVVTNIS